MNSSLRSAFSPQTVRIALISVTGLVIALAGIFANQAYASVPLVTTDSATNISVFDATLNGTNGSNDAIGHSFWVSTSTFSTASPSIPSGVYSTPDFGTISSSTSFSAQLSSVTTSGVPSNLPAITPGTTYYYAAWVKIGSTWSPGEVKNFTTVALPACSGSSTFDSFSNGSVNGQNGWSATGPYDQAVVDNTYGYASFGCKSLRLSDAMTSGSFGDWVFAPAATPDSGESAANNHYEAQFDIASALSTEQSGLTVSVSPDNGSGGRMSYLRFEDHADGVHVFFDDVTDAGPPGTTASFDESEIATLNRSAPHTVKFVIDFVSGPANDVVKIYIDGSLIHTGTSWEDYYRYDSEQAGGGNVIPVTNTLIFQARGTQHAGNSGKGYLFDNLGLTTSFVAPDTTAPSVPTLEFPSNGSATTTNDFYFTWHASTDDSGGPVTYQFQSSQDSTQTGGVLTNSLWTSGTLTSPTIHSTGAPNGAWYWQVRARDAAGNWSDWSTIWSVTLANVVTNPATSITASNATLNGAVGPAASQESFWVSTSTFSTASPFMPSGVYSTPTLGGVSAHSSFSDPLSIVTTNGIIWDGSSNQNVNMPAITPSTTYYYVAWANIGGTWYPGALQSFTTAAPPDTTKPVIHYNYPASGAFASTTLKVSATVTDAGSGLENINIHLFDATGTIPGPSCGNALHLAGVHSYTENCSVNTSAVADGHYTVYTDSFDRAGNFKKNVRPVTVDNTKPTVTMSDPTNGSSQTGTFTASGTATDALSGMDHVDYTVTKITGLGGTYLSTVDSGTATFDATTTAWSFNESGLADGYYRVKVQAFDAAGNWKYLYHDIQVVNFVPASVTTDVATGVGPFAATINGTNGPTAASNTSFWLGTTAAGPFTPGTNPGATEFPSSGWTHDSGLGSAAANGPFHTALTGLTPNTTYYFVAWSQIGGTWYPGNVLTFTTTAVVASCPVGTIQTASPIETIGVNSSLSTSTVSVSSLINGLNYLLVSSGTWQNGSVNVADTAYASTDSWATHFQGYDVSPYFLGAGEFQLQVDGGFVDWGVFSPAHTYSYLYTGAGAPVSLEAFDGDSNTNTPNPGWYGDNSGSLSVEVYACSVPVTTEDATSVGLSAATINGTNGPTAASNTSFWLGTTAAGPFTPGTNPGATEFPSSGWTHDSGLGSAAANGPFHTALTGLTPNTTYYFVAWSQIGGTWYPGIVKSFTTGHLTYTYATSTVQVADLATSTSDVAANPSKWFFWNDSSDTLNNALGSFVNGPATAPLNDGSAEITAATGTRIALVSRVLAGTNLADITNLSYATYRSNGTSALNLALQFDIDHDTTDADHSYQGRLVYEPYYTHTVLDHTWQTWNTMDNATSSGNGNWWFSNSGLATGSGCSQVTPCTWSEVLAAYPNASISGGTFFKAGQWIGSAFTGNVDDFVVAAKSGTDVAQVTYDFEPTAPTPPGGGSGGSGGGSGGLVGDLNHDNSVDFIDFAIMLSQFGSTGTPSGDLNGDHTVDVADLAILLAHWTH